MFLKSDDFSSPAPLTKQISISSVLLSDGICSLCLPRVCSRCVAPGSGQELSCTVIFVSGGFTRVLSRLMRSSKIAK